MLIAVFVILIVLMLLLFLIAPSGSKRAEAWRGMPFAHRGLHGDGVVENTLPAFEAACRAGVGIELDVQLSRDGVPVVFHDDTLERMTGDGRRVDELSLDELRMLMPEIPTFDEVLTSVNGRVPLLVELKNGRRNPELCRKAVDALRAYEGRFVMESFNPLMLGWLRKNAPEIIRGQLVDVSSSYVKLVGPLQAFVLSRLALNCIARPDFVAYNINAHDFSAPRLQRALFHTPMAAWTVRDEQTCRNCMERGEMPIFEGFSPERIFRR